MLWFGGIVVTGVYEQFEEVSYFVVGLGMALPYAIVPLFFPGQVRRRSACAHCV